MWWRLNFMALWFKAVFEMIADENTVMIKAAHVGQLLLLKKEKE